MSSGTHHVPEGGAGALAGRVVLQDGGVVDQFSDVFAAIQAQGRVSNLSIEIKATLLQPLQIQGN